MSLKKDTIDDIIDVEADYVNNPYDSGGETRFGITVAVARANGYFGPMRYLPREIAFDIYAVKYWDAVSADDIAALSNSVAAEVVDTGVNLGTNRAGEILQRSLNVLNVAGRLYSDLTVDGAIGPATLSALRWYLAKRDKIVLLRALNCLQGAYYIELAERREKDERFVYGWLMKRVVL